MFARENEEDNPEPPKDGDQCPDKGDEMTPQGHQIKQLTQRHLIDQLTHIQNLVGLLQSYASHHAI